MRRRAWTSVPLIPFPAKGWFDYDGEGNEWTVASLDQNNCQIFKFSRGQNHERT